MKWPKSVVILGKEYDILWFDSREQVDIEGRHQYFGQTCYIEGQIRLFNKPKDGELLHTFLHEVLHVTLRELGYHDQNNDEDFVDRLSLALADFLRRNDLIRPLDKPTE